ncbi:DUF4468 domain-containing protein [Chryseobacterium sp. PCH239]|uniref:DUF4468 domain-containing protein n=1 Tax=Chryseobacterium sp. PCH239 TaxID=2825845 RepID=UPI001C1219D2|nr:DUF4468 domain-containing protein [Chryseobacterium sp. PCH239]QWT88162.1 DUF4468 domain-containing protein [Chryseobacterium sp. PCH239]
MKNLFTILFTLVNLFLFSQEKLSYSKVIKVDSTISKDVLFNRVSNKLSTLFGSNFKYERDVILSDKSQGIIKIKFTKPYHKGESFSNVAGDIDFNMTFLFKDGKSKVDLTDFKHYGNTSLGTILDTDSYPYNDKKMFKKTMDKNWIKLREFLDEYKNTLFDISSNLLTKPDETENNNW